MRHANKARGERSASATRQRRAICMHGLNCAAAAADLTGCLFGVADSVKDGAGLYHSRRAR